MVAIKHDDAAVLDAIGVVLQTLDKPNKDILLAYGEGMAAVQALRDSSQQIDQHHTN